MGGEILAGALISVLFFSWFTPKHTFEMFLKPVPRSVKIHHGHRALFSVWIHFSASPEDVALLIQSRHLDRVADSTEPTEATQERARSVKPVIVPQWWQPQDMTGAVFYYRAHGGTAAPWSEGVWVNDKTNEVFAYVRG